MGSGWRDNRARTRVILKVWKLKIKLPNPWKSSLEDSDPVKPAASVRQVHEFFFHGLAVLFFEVVLD